VVLKIKLRDLIHKKEKWGGEKKSDEKSGKVEKWKSGKVEKWKSGKMEKWKNGKLGFFTLASVWG
jgi:hypothetical protein